MMTRLFTWEKQEALGSLLGGRGSHTTVKAQPITSVFLEKLLVMLKQQEKTWQFALFVSFSLPNNPQMMSFLFMVLFFLVFVCFLVSKSVPEVLFFF